MDQPLHPLRRADQPARAAAHRLARRADGVAATGRANVGKHERRRSIRPTIHHYRNDLRDHVAGALQNDGVTDADILARDFVLIVQRRPRDQDAAHIHRFQFGNRVRAPVRPTWMRISRSTVVACSAGNFQAIAHRGARPTKPSRALQAEVVDLVDDTVDIIAKAGTREADLVLKRFRIRLALQQPRTVG